MYREMQPRSIQNAAALLGVCILAVLVTYRNSTRTMLAGILYLMAAVLLDTVCLSLAAILRGRATVTKAFPQTTPSSLDIRAHVLLLAAWQMAIIGALNVAVADLPRSRIPFMVDYLLAALFFIFSYRMVSIADSSAQDGGYKPLNFTGYPRTRRLTFILFSGFCIIAPFIIASLEFAIRGPQRPTVFQHPQLCLLIAAISSVMSVGFVLERYRGPARDRPLRRKIFVVTFSFLAVTGVIQKIFSYGMYVYTLSAISVIGTAIAVYCFWRIAQKAPEDAKPVPILSTSAGSQV